MEVREMAKVLLVSFLCAICILAEADDSAKKVEDCQAFNEFGDKMKALTQAYKLTDSCTTFSNCSGLNCSGNGPFKSPYSVSLGVEHCQEPVRLWMHLSVPGINIDEWRELKDGTRSDIFKDKNINFILPMKVSAYVTPALKRVGGNITLGGQICVLVTTLLPTQQKCQTLPKVSVPVSSALCGSTGPYLKSTVKTPHSVATETERHSQKVLSHAKTSSKPADINTKVNKKSSRSSAGKIDTLPITTTAPKKNTSFKKKHQKAHSKARGSSRMATGTMVAVVSSVILAVLLLIGLFAYWRKLKKKRPAYYNDISVNAGDEMPFVDSHMVL